MTTPVVAAAIPSTSTLQSAAHSSNSGFNHADLVFNVDIFLLAFLAFFVLLSLPRAVIRFSHRSEWFAGLWLSYVEPKRWRPPTFYALADELDIPESAYVSPTKSSKWPRTDVAEKDSDEGLHRNVSTSSNAHLLRNNTTSTNASRAQLIRAQSRRNRMKKLDLPVHMPSWTTMLPSLSWVTRISVRPGLSLGGASIMIAYFVTLCYAGVWESNIFSDPLRMGWVAISQLPVVIVLATKNNPVGILIGACYTRLNYLHRFSGRLMVIAVNIHALGYFYSWSLPNTASGTTPPTFNHQLFKPTHLTGFVALIAADVMFVTSLSWMRQRFHGTFKTLHVLGMIVFLIGCYLHAPQATAYLLIAVGIYLFDRLVRLLKTRYTTARVTALSELGMTRVEVLGTNAGWRAGQHVRVRVLERELGGPTGLGMLECHPFTICSVSESPSGENLTLMCKKTGMWTNKLFELARGMEYGSVSSDGSRAEKGSAPRDVRLLIEGPYGGPNHTIYSSFSGALVVAGGSGITYALGVVQDLLQKDRDGRSRLKCIELVWSVQDPSAILPLLHHFSFLLAQSNSKLYYTSLQISVSYTRCFANPPPHVVKVLQHLPAGLRVSPGRPKLQNILNSVVDRACALFHRGLEDDGRRAKPAGRSADSKRTGSRPAGVFVTVCGPQSMAEDLRRVVRSVDPDRRKRAGGVEMFDEVFGG